MVIKYRQRHLLVTNKVSKYLKKLQIKRVAYIKHNKDKKVFHLYLNKHLNLNKVGVDIIKMKIIKLIPNNYKILIKRVQIMIFKIYLLLEILMKDKIKN